MIRVHSWAETVAVIDRMQSERERALKAEAAERAAE